MGHGCRADTGTGFVWGINTSFPLLMFLSMCREFKMSPDISLLFASLCLRRGVYLPSELGRNELTLLASPFYPLGASCLQGACCPKQLSTSAFGCLILVFRNRKAICLQKQATSSDLDLLSDKGDILVPIKSRTSSAKLKHSV